MNYIAKNRSMAVVVLMEISNRRRVLAKMRISNQQKRQNGVKLRLVKECV